MPAISQFVPLPVLRQLLRENPVDERYRKRARSRLIFSAALEPLRWLENLRHGRKLRRTHVEDPIFLLGFGRSGTTHLHNLFWKDGRFGVVTNYQANFHPIALIGRGRLDRMFADKMPSKRPMDNVAISLDGPQEEEIAMVNSTLHAPLHFMNFPNALPGIYDRYVSDLGSDRALFEAWKKSYLEVLRKATILADDKRLVLKTPPNTARINVLLEMFPDARFVNIVRNPYRVYPSMLNMYRKILPGQVLQELEWEQIDAWVLDAYRSQMMKYLDERKSIPEGRLHEIRYEDLDARPLEVLPEIYQKLELPDFEAVRPQITAYLESLGSFEKNVFELPAEVVEVVNESWGFAFDAFGYERLEPGAAPA